MTTSTSGYKWIPRKSTLHRHERPFPKPQIRKRQVPEAKVKMELDMEEFLDTQGLSEQSSSQQPPLESPELPVPAPATLTSEMVNTDAVHTEAQAPAHPINSSALVMSSRNSKDLGEDLAISCVEKITAVVQSTLESVLEGGSGIKVGAPTEVPGFRLTSPEIQQRSPEQGQDETSVNVSELVTPSLSISSYITKLSTNKPKFSTARPLSTVMEDLLNAELDRKIRDVSNLAAELERKEVAMDTTNKKFSDALDEIAVLRENEKRTAAMVERLEVALRKKARELVAQDQKLKLKDLEFSGVKERLKNLNKTLLQERELLEATKAEIPKKKEFR
ncbi:hypothetical protein RUND412_007928 [Rhizina undulata]